MAHTWSMKYKKSIRCNRPKGFSQKQYCKGRKTRKGLKVGGNRTIPHLRKNLKTIKKGLNKYYDEILGRCGNDNIRHYTTAFKTITENLLEIINRGTLVENAYIEILIEACTRWSNLLHSRQGQCADETVKDDLYTIESTIVGCVDTIEEALESRSSGDPVANQV